jgi:hypothetical protein
MGFSIRSLVVVTAAYVASFGLVNGLIAPVQNAVFPAVPPVLSLIFLPHGVRILTFFFFGGMGLIYLFPAAFSMWALMVYGAGQNGYHIAGTAISLISCYIGVALARHFFIRIWTCASLFSWQQIMVAGLIGSIGNAAGLSLLQFSAPSPMIFSAYIIGDITGLFLVLVVLMGSFRLFDRETAKSRR